MNQRVVWEAVKNQFVIANDYVFGHVVSNPDVCTSLLKAILPEIQINGLVDVVRQSTKDIGMSQKGIRLDIEARDTDGRVYDIEMQNVRQREDLEQRIRYYGSMIDCDKIKKGESYKELPQVFIIFVCAFDYLNQGRAIYDFSMRDRYNPSLELLDGRRVIMINCNNPIFFPKGEYNGLSAFIRYVRTNVPIDELTNLIDWYVSEYKKKPTEREAFMNFMSRDAEWEDRIKRAEIRASEFEAKWAESEAKRVDEKNKIIKLQEEVDELRAQLAKKKD